MATLPSPTNLEMFWGDYDQFAGTVTGESGSAADLTDGDITLVFTVASALGSTALITKDLDDGIAGEADGDYVLTIAPGDHSSLARNGTYYYSLVLTESSGQPQTVAWGTFTFRGRV